MTLEELLQLDLPMEQVIARLKEKAIVVPAWSGKDGLETEYNPKKHPVMNKAIYPDISTSDGVQKVTRVIIDLQRLATSRMTQLMFGIPVKRVYKPENYKQKEVATFLEKVFMRNRIDSVNEERSEALFASCEVMTLWYAIHQPNTLYGVKSPVKIRCRNYSPKQGDELYPLFDEFGDMTALSVGYSRKSGRKTIKYFDTYTESRHIKWSNASGNWSIEEDEGITLGKIPAIYTHRPTPIWEETSNNVFEMEWSLSRNGNYLRENSKPLFMVFADEVINYGNEKTPEKEAKAVMQFPKGSTAGYVTWQQAIENLKFFISELRSWFFTQLQIPDWSYEKMAQQAISGESRKQMFVDAHLKVRKESGRFIEYFDREVNVVKAYAKVVFGESYHDDIDALEVEHIITPFTINDEKETIQNLTAANGGKPIMSQRESIELFGHSDDVDQTLEEIRQQELDDVFQPQPSI